MIDTKLLLDIDNLDHFTWFADRGRPLPMYECLTMLRRCSVLYPQTAEAAKVSDDPTEEEVYAAIRRTRTVLMEGVE